MKTYQELLKQVNAEKGGLVDALQAIQERDGYLSKEALKLVAEFFSLPANRVYETASFYSYLSLKPQGRHTIRICESAPCHVADAADLVAALEDLLQTPIGQTSADNRFSLSYTGCVGQCQASPVLTIDKQIHLNVTTGQLPQILAAYL